MVPNSSTVLDAKLHAAWQRGDLDAAADLVVRYRPRLRSLGEQLGLSGVDAEDLAQQVLLEAPRSSFEPRQGSTYFNWLSTIARRKASRMLAKASQGIPVRRLTTPWTATWRTELFASIETMPEPIQDIFWRLAAGYTPLEIERELDLPATTIRTRIYRGRKWLKNRGH